MTRSGRFLQMPPYFGGRLKTRLLTILCANHQCTIYELAPLLERKKRSQIYLILRRFIRMGIIAEAQLGIVSEKRLGKVKSYFLNPKHPSYKGFRRFGSVARIRWSVPINYLPRIPKVYAQRCTLPSNPSCNLYGIEISTKALLFIAAAGSANSVQLSDMLGTHNADAQGRLASLERRGLITRKASQTGRPRPAVINPDLFAYDA
jgi:predicted transcriptional regulator